MSSNALKNGQNWPASTRRQGEAGQVLLLVVLASVIALTVGLAAISRSITSTRISSEESNSQKALAAAEAGIEEQINRAFAGAVGEDNTLLTNDLNDNSSFISEAEPVLPKENDVFELSNGETIRQDEGADIWLSDHRDFNETSRVRTTILTIYWKGDNTDCNKEPAIEVAVLYGDRDRPSMRRYAIDKCKDTRRNRFDLPNVSTNFPSGYNRGHVLPSIEYGYIARVIPLYASANIAVRSTASLPVQGYVIESTGEAGDTVRKLRVFQGLPKLPIEFFPYNLFLPSN